jgi:hypothetical protein
MHNNNNEHGLSHAHVPPTTNETVASIELSERLSHTSHARSGTWPETYSSSPSRAHHSKRAQWGFNSGYRSINTANRILIDNYVSTIEMLAKSVLFEHEAWELHPLIPSSPHILISSSFDPLTYFKHLTYWHRSMGADTSSCLLTGLLLSHVRMGMLDIDPLLLIPCRYVHTNRS